MACCHSFHRVDAAAQRAAWRTWLSAKCECQGHGAARSLNRCWWPTAGQAWEESPPGPRLNQTFRVFQSLAGGLGGLAVSTPATDCVVHLCAGTHMGVWANQIQGL